MNTLAQSTKKNKFTPKINTSNLLVQRKCACGGASKLGEQCPECEKKKLLGGNVLQAQPRLKISQSNDKHGQEANRSADEVMQMPKMLQPGMLLAGASTNAVGHQVELSNQFGMGELDNARNSEDGRSTETILPFGNSKKAGVRFSKNKEVCLDPGSFIITMGEHQNDSQAATGLLKFSFKASGKSRFTNGTQQLFSFGKKMKGPNGLRCDCDCMAYRQFIRGIGFFRNPGEPLQKIGEITSGHSKLPLLEQWQKEDISTIFGKSIFGCERDFEDHPGIESNASVGTDVLVRLNFLLQVWDMCQQKAVKESQQTLTISGDQIPKKMKWEAGSRPLTDVMPREVGDFPSQNKSKLKKLA